MPANVRVHDERLSLSLFASSPDIVTPIGIAVDEMDRVFVLESHTHTPPSDYDGPKTDRIRVFFDEDRDGRVDSVHTFAEGIEDGMNLAFSPDGTLYVVSSRSVMRLEDSDEDLRGDAQDTVLALAEPASVYDHAALLGITFSPDGWMYVSRGNTSGDRWIMEGTDGSWAAGYGDGGNIMRSRPDGSHLTEVATGFWNPFDLKFDAAGRLLAIDNDPDSRGPNRIVHVVEGGDFGYKSMYGGSGIHPFLAWNGELPGTLPYISGIGEAPSGMIDASLTSLPADFSHSFLATIWEESRIVRIDVESRGVSLKGTSRTIISGDAAFRPVAFAADRHGIVYFTDWVKRTYPVHSEGRIWRLEVKGGGERLSPRKEWQTPVFDENLVRLQQIYALEDASQADMLFEALASGDPFLQTAGRFVLRKEALRNTLFEATASESTDIRLQAMTAMQGLDDPRSREVARRLLTDDDPRVRKMALVWIGRDTMHELLPDVLAAFRRGNIEPDAVETFLATVRHLQPEFYQAYRSRSVMDSKQLMRKLPDGFVASIVADTSLPEASRAMAIPYLESPADHKELLIGMLGARDAGLRAAVLDALYFIADDEVAEALLEVARSADSAGFRADALVGLARQPTGFPQEVAGLLDGSPPDIALEAARYLRSYASDGAVKAHLQHRLDAERSAASPDEGLVEQLKLILEPGSAPMPDPDAWLEAMPAGGDAGRGRRVFFSPGSQCATCHSVEGRGGTFGPELTNIGASKTRLDIARSIVFPSEEISPEWQGWYVQTSEGKRHSGRQIDVGLNSVELLKTDGTFETYRDVEQYGVMPASLMPEGLHRQMTPFDFADLLAFLTGDG